VSVYDPIALGRTVGLDAVRADAAGTRPRLQAIPGGRVRMPGSVPVAPSHVTNLRPSNPAPTTRLVFLTDLEASLTIAALRASTSQAARDVADNIAAQWSRPQHPSMQDQCDPHGMPRPL